MPVSTSPGSQVEQPNSDPRISLPHLFPTTEQKISLIMPPHF